MSSDSSILATLSPVNAATLADAILALHVGVVAFVVIGTVLILIGGWRRWDWVRGFAWRVAHLLLMGFVVVQTWLGEQCPLTVWEQALRRRAGQLIHDDTFIEHWLSRLIFFEAPWWVFVVAYTAFAALVLLTWRLVPPRRDARKRRTD
ncbi:DUF2784 domain-containing protein [Montanilutibacter psychrotolerans]|uniref:DUF2784 domain-containing protein n=1 Tax=Montanilutibacter psychrotolerans TaxID=1327343 RepID=A0A3M8SMN3_9GAMM|nr:DUF2784 domain-containing protein [Lysobacter psychrotolerans]RNF82083.1 DUF2784 domain-containing protein [Lysobacter psychrotolerans]